MGHSRVCFALTTVILLCICSGCIPVAYVCPDVDVFSADLRDLDRANRAKISADDSQGVVTVEQEAEFHFASPMLQCSKDQHIRLLETDTEVVRHLSCGLAARCEILSALSYGYERQYDSQLKAYRRGYQTLTILPWKPLKHADWRPAETLQEREIAIDLLVVFQTELGTPLPLPEGEGSPRLERRIVSTKIDADTSLLLADEYEWLAAVTWRMLAADASHVPRSGELNTIYQRLRYKSQYWRERDADSPIVTPWITNVEIPEVVTVPQWGNTVPSGDSIDQLGPPGRHMLSGRRSLTRSPPNLRRVPADPGGSLVRSSPSAPGDEG